MDGLYLKKRGGQAYNNRVKGIIPIVFGLFILVAASVGFYMELRFWRFHKPSLPERLLSYFVLMAILAMALVLVFVRHLPTIARAYLILMPIIVIGALGVSFVRLFVIRSILKDARAQREALLKDIAQTLAKTSEKEKPESDHTLP